MRFKKSNPTDLGARAKKDLVACAAHRGNKSEGGCSPKHHQVPETPAIPAEWADAR